MVMLFVSHIEEKKIICGVLKIIVQIQEGKSGHKFTILQSLTYRLEHWEEHSFSK